MQLHIIEPTLNHPSGHCFTIVHALAKAAHAAMPDLKVHAWTGKQFDPESMADVPLQIHPYFHRKIRRFQLWGLLRKLCADEQTVLLPTAGRPELALYSLIPHRWRQHGDVWFYLHQLRMDGSRAKRLSMLATKIPQANILCTHPSLLDKLAQAGFQNARVQPCPFEPPVQAFSDTTFEQLIFPGEARVDKNLPFIHELLRHLKAVDANIPVMIQAGPNHHGIFSDTIRKILSDIQALNYAHLDMPQCSLAGDHYLQQFAGGICLQPYQTGDYASKISGITLDALTRGCPCIAQKGTWPAEVVDEFQAGIVCENQDVAEWTAAIRQVIDHYPLYQQGCVRAMMALSERHHPLRTLETILGDQA
ncbi:MAG: hypothetical protein CO186_08755 [Zetaproteobacteria bacterium CG_4_9_14_3_um_filter_49_83]|nr:MAG: hypothetical protein AUJ56_04300 [Zetaproteobacteria bacterium CG1_02_49_23]PIQ31632.1 MAG: hypothetical protein COW62_09100 [Zetaproteobacteria bacterium CG17_big_fil_post_rev_8_21_14_2_50_50_13]PIY55498.1 MAG: hypothetical protein COZ00_09005 [Zetaproteobacteria bacterium CG_4_10_14_0_8_um_filter_49_80]PJA34854.1 MAG: hypothetical protein CO186_08755 [Zetaproteobacteria bacterium CG_4_9_14_3_um_filter_49_83]